MIPKFESDLIIMLTDLRPFPILSRLGWKQKREHTVTIKISVRTVIWMDLVFSELGT